MKKEIMKVIILILIPINAWLFVLWYIKKQQRELFLPSLVRHQSNTAVRVGYFREKLGLQPGRRLLYPFPARLTLLGKAPPVGQGKPVLFINIDWITFPEIWEPAIREALKTSPDLHIVLLHSMMFDLEPSFLRSPQAKIIKRRWESEQKEIRKMFEHFRHPRLSTMSGSWVRTAFGGQFGILAFLCDGMGIVRVVEPYPSLKLSPKWSEEVSDWRPKLHKAVKRVLEKFFPKSKE